LIKAKTYLISSLKLFAFLNSVSLFLIVSANQIMVDKNVLEKQKKLPKVWAAIFLF